MRYFNVFLSILLFLTSCEEKDKDATPTYSFETYVDSSFYCEVYIDGKKTIFNNHVKNSLLTYNFIDSLLYSFAFNYKDTLENEVFSVQISKMFTPDELENTYIDEYGTYTNGPLTSDEFISVFQERSINYTKYDTNYIRCLYCKISEGASVSYVNQTNTWSNAYSIIHLPSDGITEFYKDASFTITNVNVLDYYNIVVEGKFNVNLYDQHYGIIKSFTNGYFKGYKTNILGK